MMCGTNLMILKVYCMMHGLNSNDIKQLALAIVVNILVNNH